MTSPALFNETEPLRDVLSEIINSEWYNTLSYSDCAKLCNLVHTALTSTGIVYSRRDSQLALKETPKEYIARAQEFVTGCYKNVRIKKALADEMRSYCVDLHDHKSFCTIF